MKTDRNLRKNFQKFSLKALMPKVKLDVVKFISICQSNLKPLPAIFETPQQSNEVLEEPQWFSAKLGESNSSLGVSPVSKTVQH